MTTSKIAEALLAEYIRGAPTDPSDKDYDAFQHGWNEALDTVRATLLTAQSEDVGEREAELVARLDALVAFLDGAEALDGVWFNEEAPPERKFKHYPTRYWWRSAHLRPLAAEIRAALTRHPTKEAENE